MEGNAPSLPPMVALKAIMPQKPYTFSYTKKQLIVHEYVNGYK